MSLAALKLCLLTHPDYQLLADYEQFILNAVQGGVSSVQLRSKNLAPAILEDFAQKFTCYSENQI